MFGKVDVRKHKLFHTDRLEWHYSFFNTFDFFQTFNLVALDWGILFILEALCFLAFISIRRYIHKVLLEDFNIFIFLFQKQLLVFLHPFLNMFHKHKLFGRNRKIKAHDKEAQ